MKPRCRAVLASLSNAFARAVYAPTAPPRSTCVRSDHAATAARATPCEADIMSTPSHAAALRIGLSCTCHPGPGDDDDDDETPIGDPDDDDDYDDDEEDDEEDDTLWTRPRFA